MTIHQVSVDGPTAALLREAALASEMTLLDFETQVLGVWADAYFHRQLEALAVLAVAQRASKDNPTWR